MEERRIIANNIKAERVRKGLSQEETAKMLGVTRETYNGYERGHIFDSACLYKLSIIFGCSLDSFFIGYNPTICGE